MFIIYHNPRCSKSRQTLDILKQNELDIEIIHYLKNPPSALEIKSIAKKLSLTPIEFIRTKEPEFMELGLKDLKNSNEKLYEIMSQNPKLIERPIVIKGEKGIIGRPPENVKKLF